LGYLDTGVLGQLSNVDLVLRTSGEQRLSNFLLWQIAYAELIFLDKTWPEFRAEDLRDALGNFSRRERRFGEVQEKASSRVSPMPASAEVVE